MPQPDHRSPRLAAAGLPRHALALALCLAFGLAAAPSALAQAAPARIDIPAQALAQALNELARQAKLQLLVAPELVAGKSAPAVSGALLPAEALRRLLAGSGLEAVSQGASTLIRRIAPAAAAPEAALPEVSVRAAAEPLPGEPLAVYAGGQVARGGRVGILGDKDVFETPFNVTSYTAKAIADKQITRIADIVKSDPSVKDINTPSSYDQGFVIRGFRAIASGTTFDGGPGIFQQYGANSAVGVERVELFKGASSLLTGNFGDATIGGSINIVPKRATVVPVTSVAASYASDSLHGFSVDLGRRFGETQDFGLRFNGFTQNGETAIEDAREKRRDATLAFDYKGERARLFVDVGESVFDTRGLTSGIGSPSGIPPLPRRGSNYLQPYTLSDTKLVYGVARADFDVTDNVVLRVNYGASEGKYRQFASYGINLDAAGNFDETFYNYVAANDSRGWLIELSGTFATGPVKHRVVFSGTKSRYGGEAGYVDPLGNWPDIRSNLYHPVRPPPPSDAFLSGDGLRESVERYEPSSATTWAVADTLSTLDERWQLVAGVRQQGAGGTFAEKALTPAVAVLFKATQRVSLYANYIEALEGGPTAPNDGTVENPNQQFPPSRNKQIEAGVKVAFGRFGLTTDVFQIVRPSARRDPITRFYVVDGRQRNRGLEINVFGELGRSVRLNGGVQFLQAKLTKTEEGRLDGKRATGVPVTSVALSGEWDLPLPVGLTLTGAVSRQGSVYVDENNALPLQGYTLADLGLRYSTKVADRPLTLRLGIDNVFDKNYWATDYSGGGLFQGSPRTVKVSAEVDF